MKHLDSKYGEILEDQSGSRTYCQKLIVCHENVMEVICSAAGFYFGDVSSV
jgi:hypothetical protein